MTLDELQTWPEPDDESPFCRPLVPNWTSPHIRRFDGDPRFVVRLVPALQLASSPDLLPTTMTLHAELERFGIPVPRGSTSSAVATGTAAPRRSSSPV